jgi:hypothetical protein
MSTQERLFTVEEAEAQLEDLRERLPRLKQARAILIRESRRIERVVAADGGGAEGRAAFEAGRSLERDVKHLAELGVLLRDPERGLVDFPAERDGRRVFLCWRLGEEHVDFWHEENSGFIGRKPL